MLPAEEKRPEPPRLSRHDRPGHQCADPQLEELKHLMKGLQSECHQVELQQLQTHSLLEKHHSEVLEIFEAHEGILLQVLGCAHSHGPPAKARRASERNLGEFSSVVQAPKGVAFDLDPVDEDASAAEDVKGEDAKGPLKRSPSRAHGSFTFTPKLFSTFTQFDLHLKEGAANVDADQARRERGLDRPSQHLSRDCCLKRYVATTAFDVFFACLVISNAIFIGVEVQHTLAHPKDASVVLQVIRNSYTALFTLEIILRIAVYGRAFFRSDDWFWNGLDAVLVICSLWEVALEIVSAAQDEEGGMLGFTGLRTVRIVRVTRLVRVAKLGRILRFVMALRTLIQSIIYTLKALVWALVLLALIIYFFAILFTQAVSDSQDAEWQPEVDRYFNSLPDTMLSLFMCISGGVSWENVIYPLRRLSPAWAMVFVFFISFCNFAVLNVVTGVFCQSAIDSAQSDHQMVMQSILANKEAHIEKIKLLFNEIDAQDRGLITYQMFEEKVGDQAVKAYFESMDLNVWDAWSFFKLLDLDSGGAVEIEEFLMGCLRLRGTARAIDIAKLIHEQAWLLKNQGHFWTFVEVQLQELRQQLNQLAPTAVRPVRPVLSGAPRI
ncbi:unnamed protein product [Durusdinium trenchii]|uniref:Ion transport domain-containing protein n=1 Tax=Durusdinium trenchii TaxID=1381693 RepID=A0ABP0PA83_9DINO